ncbi:alpha-2-macroglobulin-like protein 1 [Eleutherodactylus coqui]|uniref:alpha-2-macroglobulin-like protein 1 n=1 Tax=Eleutherodactylus coqui TaxID=57060 RepID=UPI003462249F
MWLLCLLLSMDGILVQSSKIPSFALFIPPDVYHGLNNLFCLHSSPDLQGFTKMTVDLKTTSGSETLYTVQPDSPTWHCTSFQPPAPSGSTEKVTIAIHGHRSDGEKVELSSKELTARKKKIATLIQTDKAMYKPGQKVNIRMVTLDQDLEVKKKPYQLVELQDPQKNRLAQWKNVSDDSGITDLSYQLSPDAALGMYTVKADDEQMMFSVDKYVLPKFDTHIDCPSSLSIMDDKVPVSVSGLYTYGERVPGNATIKICQRKRWWEYSWSSEEKEDSKKEDLCHTHAAKIDSSGKLQLVVELSHFHLRSIYYERELEVEASVEEEGTEVKFSAPKKTIQIQSQLTELSFKDCKEYYQPGALYSCKLVLESYDGKRLSGKKVHLSIPKKEGTGKETYITDSAGEVSFQLPTSEWNNTYISLRATTDEEDEPYISNKVSVRYGSDSLYLEELHVTTKSSLSIRPINSLAISDGSVIVTVDFIIETDDSGDIELSFLILDRNRLTHGGQQTVKKLDSLSGSFQFTLPIKDNSESAKLLVFTKSQSGGIAVDITEIRVPAALKHKVSLKFAESESLPGSENKLHLQANGGSTCALRAVDKSVVMMKPEAELTESKIQKLVPIERSYIYSQGADYDYCDDQKPGPDILRDHPDAPDGRVPWRRWHSYAEKKKDIKNVLEENGLHILTSWDIVAPTTCTFELGYMSDGELLKGALPALEGRKAVESNVRPTMKYKTNIDSRDPETTTNMEANESDSPENNPHRNRSVSLCLDYSSEEEAVVLYAGKIWPGIFEEVAFSEAGLISGTLADAAEADDGGSSSEPRTIFPETWLWGLQKMPDNGSAEMSVSVPHTITEWSAQTFCVGPGGFGLSQPVSLKAFQPFFVDSTLPYSMKRGESFNLKVSVFNYQTDPMMIAASLPSSEHFKTENSKSSEKVFCLPGGMKKTVSWVVTPSIIGKMNITMIAEAVKSQELCGGKETVIPKKGRRDVVIQSVLVVPEGTIVEKTHNSLLIMDGNSVTEKVKLEYPPSSVPGSHKNFFSVCGDIMGPAMSNIGDLLAMSYGCGEQNMAGFAPNVYILQYLQKSNLINPEVLAKAKDFLQSGSTRQMTYKRSDGSYSAFGKSDPDGSTWLTAFVVKCFSQVTSTIYIDDKVIKQSMDWLKDQQKPNGCFNTRGRLLNNALKGGVDDEVSLACYVTAACMESGSDTSDPVVEKGLKCIQNEPLQNATTYKLALKAYVYTLADNEENRAAVMEKLYEKASKADGLLYWTQETKSNSESYWSKPKSVDVEMTSYVLLSLASIKNPTKQQLGDMAAIIRWLSRQQNSRGGFSSTQDTVVALQAMSMFASRTMVKGGKTTIEVMNEKGFHHRFHVDDDNRLLQQKIQLPEIPGEYTITATGRGTVIAQVTQVHNTLPAAKEDAFDMSAKPQCMKGDKMVIVVEFSYKGGRPCTNMALLEAKFLSGYELAEKSSSDLMKLPMVNRVEKGEDSVSIYIEKVTNQTQTLEIHAERKVPVSGLKPAMISIFDYYMKEEEKTISYLVTC